MCVCLPLPAPPPPTAFSRCSKPINLICGGPRLHMSRLCPILAQGSIHPVYHDRHCVCMCVCLPFLLPPPPTASYRCSLFIDLIIGGRPRLHVSRLHPILARGSIHPVYHGGHCVCVYVCPCLHPPSPTACSRCS